MSYAEWCRWLLYRQKHGPMTDARRFDRPAALLATLYSQVHSKQAGSMIDFMPWTEEPATSIDDIAAAFGAVRKR